MSDIDKLYFDGNGLGSDYDNESSDNRLGLKSIFDDGTNWNDMYDELWGDELWDDYY